MDEEPGEGRPLLGEGATVPTTPRFVIEEPVRERKLTFEEASQCLNTLGKDESGVRYAYLMITAMEKKLTDVSTILNFKHVLFLDLSGNFLNLDALQVISAMPFLIYLRAERNRIESAALNPMYYLQVLILNKNQVTETCDINQPLLDDLELGDNLIYTAQFDSERLANLKLLSLKGNHLIDLSGSYPCSLESLYVAQNDIIKINMDCYKLRNLKVLHLRDNNIRKLDGFTNELENLTYLNVRGNKINKVRQFRKLGCLPRLETLILLDNPLYGSPTEEMEKGEGAPLEEDAEAGEDEGEGEEEPIPTDKMRLPLLVLLPNLKRINKDMVSFDERETAELAAKKLTDEIFAEDSSDEETEMPTTTDFTTDYTTDTEAEGEMEEEEQNAGEIPNPEQPSTVPMT